MFLFIFMARDGLWRDTNEFFDRLICFYVERNAHWKWSNQLMIDKCIHNYIRHQLQSASLFEWSSKFIVLKYINQLFRRWDAMKWDETIKTKNSLHELNGIWRFNCRVTLVQINLRCSFFSLSFLYKCIFFVIYLHFRYTQNIHT